MDLIEREDANHILRNLTSEIEYIVKLYCKKCRVEAKEKIDEALERAERATNELEKKAI